MSTKHTPGPWTPEGSEITLATWVKGPDGKRICTMRESEHDWHNATLIAAAPRMSAALQRAAHLLAELPNQSPQLLALRGEIVETIKVATPEYYGVASAALAKATS